MKPYAMWTPDCGGAQDFDGPLLSVSTRYWPGPETGGFTVLHGDGSVSKEPWGAQPHAAAAIHLRLGPRQEDDGGGDYLVWCEQDFEAPTEAEVKDLVERWVQAIMSDIVEALGGRPAFRGWNA